MDGDIWSYIVCEVFFFDIKSLQTVHHFSCLDEAKVGRESERETIALSLNWNQ